MFNDGTTWSERGVVFRAVKAEHSDDYAIGVIISAEGKNYYHTGDTLYNESVFASLPPLNIDILFLPVNGVGNNMNIEDAKAFSRRVNAKITVPMHCGMFDEKIIPKFMDNVVLPSIYKRLDY